MIGAIVWEAATVLKTALRRPNLAKIAVMLASLLVALPLSAFAQRERNRQDVQPTPQRVAPAPEHEFRGHVYHGRRDWTDGRWHHEMRDGRLGWWWDVGGLWYFYPEQSEG